MMDIIEDQMMTKTQELKVTLQRNAEAASASLGMLYSSTFLNDVHFLQRENYDQLGSLQGHFMAYIRNEVPPEEEEEDFVYPKMDTTKPVSPKDPVYYPNTDDDLDAARKTNSPSNSINVNVGGGDILNANVRW
ncbi:hypothetical protein Avbf_15496 [Armadillidium vulgare]|nr:hypothetical protein Avbf_15496 [Armadillidium vulgare]